MKEMIRAMHFDFHTMPGYENLFENFSATEFAQKLQDNHVKYINFTARCNIGFSYYDTKVGVKYKGLTRDVLKEVVSACHQKGIGVTAYLNAGLNHEHAFLHPDWMRIDMDGKVYRGGTPKSNFFRSMCTNTGYGEHLLNEIKEICEYDVDGIFTDCWAVDFDLCVCPKCVEKMRKQGYDPFCKASVHEFHKKDIKEFGKKVAEIVGKDKKLFLNGVEWTDGLQTHAEVEWLPYGGWGYDGFFQRASYARTKRSDLVYMTGRFCLGWGDFGGIMPLPAFEHDMFDAIMHGYNLSFGDHLHPVDGLSNTVIERVGKVYSQLIEYEKWIKGAKYQSEVALLLNDGWYQIGSNTVAGATRMLNELKITFDVYDLDGDFNKAKLVIIPFELTLNEVNKQKLLDYKSNGGKFLFTGKGIKTAIELGLNKAIEFVKDDESDNAYFYNGTEKWAMYKPSVVIKNTTGTLTNWYVSNYFNNEFDGRHSYFYRPQNKVTSYCASCYDESCAFVCFDVFDGYSVSYLQAQKTLVSTLIDALYSDRFILANNFRASTNVSVTKNDKYTFVNIKATHAEIRNGKGVVEDHDTILGGEISLKGNFNVFAIPQDKEIKCSYNHGRTQFSTGVITGFQAYRLEKA